MKIITSLLIPLILIRQNVFECLKGCLKCNSNDDCLFCDVLKLYVLESGSCNQYTKTNCSIIDLNGQCLLCNDGYAVDQTTQQCTQITSDLEISNCISYTDIQFCEYCDEGFYLKSNSCLQSTNTIENCLILDQLNQEECLQCKTGYIVSLNSLECVQFNEVSNCSSYTTLKCNQCDSDFTINWNKYIYDIFQFLNPTQKNEIITLIEYNKKNIVDTGPIDQCSRIDVQNCKVLVNYYQCEECEDLFYLDESQKCQTYPEEEIPHCVIYQDSQTCIKCDTNMFLFSSQECRDIVTIDNCVSYDPTQSETICIQCSDDYYLKKTENYCSARTNKSKFEDCLKRNIYADYCDECVQGKVLTSDSISCLAEVLNCLNYEPSTSSDTELVCVQCINTFYYNVTTMKCIQGAIDYCLVYSDIDSCIQCSQGSYLKNGTCQDQNQLEGCNEYSITQINTCNQCKEGYVLFYQVNGCKQAQLVKNCTQYSDILSCSDCEIDYFLKDGDCLEIIQPSNCRKVNSQLQCTQCESSYIISDLERNCILPQDYFTTYCASSNIDGSQLFSNVYCEYCTQNSLFMNYRGQYICTLQTSMDQNTLITKCIKYKQKDSLECLQCSSGYFLKNNTCVSNCLSGQDVEVMYLLEYIGETESTLSLSVQTNRVCIEQNQSTQFTNCQVAYPSLTQKQPINEYDNYTCIKCQSSTYSVINKSQYIITDDYTSYPFGKSIVGVYPGLKCINEQNSSNQTQITLVTNCKYYYSDTTYAGSTIALTYGCLKCIEGYQGVMSATARYISSCQDMVATCNKSAAITEGISHQYIQLDAIKTSWQSYYSCFDCLDESKIPFIGLYFVSDEIPHLSNKLQNSSGLKVTIVCENPFSWTYLNTNINTQFPQNCSLGIFSEKVYNAVGVVTSGSISANPQSNTTTIYCIACNILYKPLYATTVTNQNVNQVYECVPMTNCKSSTWFNSCSQCKDNHSYVYDTITKLIDYSDCKLYDDSYCYAFYVDLEGNSVCKFCKKGYSLNLDGQCELINGTKCTSSYTNFVIDITFHIESTISILFQLYDQGPGCNSCFSGYVGVFQESDMYLCTYSSYVENNNYIVQTNLISNCKNYGINEGNNVCIICDLNYIPSTNGNCYLQSTQKNCTILNGTQNCSVCNSGYVVVSGACELQNIDNCEIYVSSSSLTYQQCQQCKPEYYRSNNYKQCIKGNVQDCKIMINDTRCEECKDGYFKVTIENNYDYCYQLSSSLNCQQINDNEMTINRTVKCEQCIDNYALTFVEEEFENTICMKLRQTDNCKSYDVQLNLEQSTFNCSECLALYYLNSEFKCQLRSNEINNCIQYQISLDQCQQCDSGFYLSNDQLECLANPTGVKGCAKYISSNQCTKCDDDLYLSGGKCLKIENPIPNCVYYDSDQNCSQCIQKMVVESGECVLASAKNCLTYKSKIACNSCPEGYGFEESNSIVNCVAKNKSNCEVSDNEYPFDCQLCKEDYYSDDQGNCQEISKQITNCKYYEADGVCLLCDDKAILSLDKKTCSKANYLQALLDSNCIQASIVDPFCQSCAPGYIMSQQGKCQECNSKTYSNGCFICDPTDNSVCIMCKSEYYMTKDGNCNKTTTEPDNGGTVTPSKSSILFISLIFYLLFK